MQNWTGTPKHLETGDTWGTARLFLAAKLLLSSGSPGILTRARETSQRKYGVAGTPERNWHRRKQG